MFGHIYKPQVHVNIGTPTRWLRKECHCAEFNPSKNGSCGVSLTHFVGNKKIPKRWTKVKMSSLKHLKFGHRAVKSQMPQTFSSRTLSPPTARCPGQYSRWCHSPFSSQRGSLRLGAKSLPGATVLFVHNLQCYGVPCGGLAEMFAESNSLKSDPTKPFAK